MYPSEARRATEAGAEGSQISGIAEGTAGQAGEGRDGGRGARARERAGVEWMAGRAGMIYYYLKMHKTEAQIKI